MSILVTCPGCQTRFTVDDKFAGKQGPCPKCKTKLTIPEKQAEVVIHAPETSGPKNAAGVSVLKPIKRSEARIGVPMLAGGIGGGVLVIALALAARFLAPRVDGVVQISPWILGSAALLLAPPLVLLFYSFLRDDELEPHRGQALLLRVAACSVVYAGLWGLRSYLGYQLEWTSPIELYQTLILIPAMLIPGTLAALASLELEATSAGFHCAGYLGATVLLRVLAGLPAL